MKLVLVLSKPQKEEPLLYWEWSGLYCERSSLGCYGAEPVISTPGVSVFLPPKVGLLPFQAFQREFYHPFRISYFSWATIWHFLPRFLDLTSLINPKILHLIPILNFWDP